MSPVLQIMQGSLSIGAAVTQTGLIDYLLGFSSSQHHSNGNGLIKHGMTALAQTNGDRSKSQLHGGSVGVYTALAHHLQRIAGNQVC